MHGPMKRQRLLAVVDRVEGRTVVLELEGIGELTVGIGSLPSAAEGAVFRVATLPNGDPDWKSAVRDHAEEAKRRNALEKRLGRLRKDDDGRDIDL
jgi:hypothetical protein